MKRSLLLLIMFLMALPAKATIYAGTFLGQSTNALTVANVGHVLVLTNGFSGITNWIPDSVDPLQHAVNYYTNFVGPTVASLQGNMNPPAVINSNAISPSFEVVGTFFPNGGAGLVLPNTYVYSSWGFYGRGRLNSAIIGNSNVFMGLTNLVRDPAANAANVSDESYHIQDICFVYSNAAQKAVAVNLAGCGCYGEFANNVICQYSVFASTNFNTAAQGSGSSSWNTGNTVRPGIVPLLVDGSFGQQDIHDNQIAGGAIGMALMSSHIKCWNNECDAIGQQNGTSIGPTNVYAINDTTSYFRYTELQGFDLAPGENYLITGDDIHILDNKCLGGHYDVACNGAGGSFGGGVYGPVIIENEHCEAITGDDLLFLASTSVKNMVRLHDCFDQQTADHTWSVALQTTPNYTISLNTLSDTNIALDDSFSQPLNQTIYKYNNKTLMTIGTNFVFFGGIATTGTHTPGQVTVGGSPFTFSNPHPFILECYTGGSAAYTVAKNGVTITTSLDSDHHILLQTNCTITLTYLSTTPTLYTNAF